jgi:hypothetical protein
VTGAWRLVSACEGQELPIGLVMCSAWRAALLRWYGVLGKGAEGTPDSGCIAAASCTPQHTCRSASRPGRSMAPRKDGMAEHGTRMAARARALPASARATPRLGLRYDGTSRLLAAAAAASPSGVQSAPAGAQRSSARSAAAADGGAAA